MVRRVPTEKKLLHGVMCNSCLSQCSLVSLSDNRQVCLGFS